MQCSWRKFDTHLGFYDEQLGEVYVKKSAKQQKQKLFCTAPIFEMQRITRHWIIISFELAAPWGIEVASVIDGRGSRTLAVGL